MNTLRKTGILLLIIALIPLQIFAAETTAEDCIADVLNLYREHQEAAEAEIDRALRHLEAMDPDKASLWRSVVETWSWTDNHMPVYPDVLPDGLPEDDSLCIVILGLGLDDNSAMKPELLDRLEVAIASAEKYPNARILCTGGETSRVRNVTEAKVMAAWLRCRGIGADRIILENEALSTTENVRNTYELLTRSYPGVTDLALITSDYHIRWSCALMGVTSLYESTVNGTQPLNIAANACCATDKGDYDSYHTQAWGIATITGTPWAPEVYG